jgi:hypothetical protein
MMFKCNTNMRSSCLSLEFLCISFNLILDSSLEVLMVIVGHIASKWNSEELKGGEGRR